MVQSIKLPIFGERKGHVTTAELVFRILSHSFPLRISALREELSKKYRHKVTYQAVRKAIAALSVQGVVQSSPEGYQISRGWLIKARGVIDSTIRNYSYANGKKVDTFLTTQIFTGSSLYEIDLLWGEIVVDLCAAQTNSAYKRFISINHYPWWIPLNVGHEIEFCRRLKEIDFEAVYIFSKSGKSARWAQRYYGSVGVQTIVNSHITIPESKYYNVIGEYVIEVTISESHKREIARLFGRNANPQETPVSDLVKLSVMEGQVEIAVQRNLTFAQALLRSVAPKSSKLNRKALIVD